MDIEKGIEVFADPMLERVFTNLAFNTLKHAPSAKHIKVWTEKGMAGGITIWFEDDGPGIPFDSKAALLKRNLVAVRDTDCISSVAYWRSLG